MRTPPEHDRAMLHADTEALRDCAARLATLSESGLPSSGGPEWNDVLATLAERCRIAAAELDRAAAAFFAVPGEVDEADEAGEAAGSAERAGALALALAIAGRLLAAPRAAAEPLAPLIRRLPGGGHP